ncbi:MAG: MBOAT family protein [Acidimicrobiia bacterium]|nr:MBOAT family protein [Acidimicrobiia bacterium]
MVFSSVSFLFYFLPLTLGAFFVAPKRLRNLVLMLASLVFYAWGAGGFVVILILTTALDFGLGIGMEVARNRGREVWAKVFIATSIVANVGLLAYFKYANFLVDQLNNTLGQAGTFKIAFGHVILPIGISFFTFQRMSYTIDVYRGRVIPLRNPIDFFLFVTIFPHQIAGPIIRYHQIADQLPNHQTTFEKFAAGAVRFSHGLIKKVIIADAVGVVVDATFNLPTSQLTTATAWVGILAYTLQIYFDFSGYSDMAIGLGYMFGFRIPENFKRPYSAVSITDFWRRWHISLSNWFRDYVYISLGGNRVSTAKNYRNLLIVFFLTGLWHGANWTFIVWGLYHGALLIFEKVTGIRDATNAGRMRWWRAATVFLFVVGWVPFRAPSMEYALGYLQMMFVPHGGGIVADVAMTLTPRVVVVMIAATTVFLLPRWFYIGQWVSNVISRPAMATRVAELGLLLPLSLVIVTTSTFSPFLYFQF